MRGSTSAGSAWLSLAVTMTEPQWEKCGFEVEIAKRPGAVLIRNSARPDLVLEFSLSEWYAFCAGVSDGEFDIE